MWRAGLIITLTLASWPVAAQGLAKLDYPALQAVLFSQVTIEDEFWSPRIRTVQQRTLPDLFELGAAKIRNFAVVAGLANGSLL